MTTKPFKFRRTDISVLSGWPVRAELTKGRVLEGVLEKQARKYWIGSECIKPAEVRSIIIVR